MKIYFDSQEDNSFDLLIKALNIDKHVILLYNDKMLFIINNEEDLFKATRLESRLVVFRQRKNMDLMLKMTDTDFKVRKLDIFSYKWSPQEIISHSQKL